MQIKMPVELRRFKTNSLIKLVNTGFFNTNNEFLTLSTPPSILIAQEGGVGKEIYGLNLDQCTNSFCPYSAIFFDSHTACVRSLLNNSTQGCHAENHGLQTVCNYGRVSNLGTLLSISSGELMEEENRSLQLNVAMTKQLTYTTRFVTNSSKLTCISTNSRTQFYLPGQIADFVDSDSSLINPIKFQFIKPEQHKIQVHNSLRKNFTSEIRKLKSSDDHISVANREIPTLVLILSGFGLSLLLSAICILRETILLRLKSAYLTCRRAISGISKAPVYVNSEGARLSEAV